MRQSLWLVAALAAGCAASVREERLSREVDAPLARGEVTKAIAAYERIGGRDDRRVRQAAERLVADALCSRDPAERVRAARLIADVADPTLDRLLPPLLVDADARVRAFAAVALASQADAAREVLVASVNGADAEARRIALDGLASLPDPAAVLRALATDTDIAVRAQVAGTIGGWKPTGATERAVAEQLLRQLAADVDAGVRASALRAAGAFGSRALLPDVEGRLEDPALGVRLAALSALTRLDRSSPRLALLGSAPDRLLALRAAVQLHRLGREALALTAIRDAAGDRRAEVRSAAMNAAGELGEAGVPLAQPRLRDPDLGVRLDAARALVHAGHPELALPSLVSALDTPLSLDAADELARLGDARGRDRLESTALSGDPQARAHALSLLAPLPHSFATLTHALTDGDRSVRLTAAEALLRRAYHKYL